MGSITFPSFINDRNEATKTVEYLLKKAPRITADFTKYDLVAWVAIELAKQKAFMSVPTLVQMVQEQGGATNYGAPFVGGRGSYRLVSGTYHRLERAGKTDAAQAVAEAFRKPNFGYAYNSE